MHLETKCNNHDCIIFQFPLADGSTGPPVRDLGEGAQVEVNIRNLASVRDYQLLPQTVPADIITVDIGQFRYYYNPSHL